jgi:hypothetical protein
VSATIHDQVESIELRLTALQAELADVKRRLAPAETPRPHVPARADSALAPVS